MYQCSCINVDARRRVDMPLGLPASPTAVRPSSRCYRPAVCRLLAASSVVDRPIVASISRRTKVGKGRTAWTKRVSTGSGAERRGEGGAQLTSEQWREPHRGLDQVAAARATRVTRHPRRSPSGDPAHTTRSSSSVVGSRSR